MSDEYKENFLRRNLTRLNDLIDLKIPFYTKLKQLTWIDNINQHLKPFVGEYNSNELTFSLQGVGHFRLSNFGRRTSTKEPDAKVTITLDQVTVNELMDFIKQLQEHKVYRNILNEDGSLPDYKRKRRS